MTRATAPAARDDESAGTFLLAVLVGISLAVHVAIVSGLGGAIRARARHRLRQPSEVVIEVAAPRANQPPPVAAQRPLAGPVARRAPNRPAAHAAAPPARVTAAEAPVDLSGVTLTNDGPGWASATGNGHAITGPIGRPGETSEDARTSRRLSRSRRSRRWRDRPRRPI